MTPRILITPKINPDLDGVACVYAYSYLLNKKSKNTTGGIFGKLHIEAQYIIDRFKITDISYSPADNFDKFILVDMSELAGCPEVVRAKDVIEVIDHREFNKASKSFPNAKIQIEKVGAAATLITERYYDENIKIDRNSAILLYSAIFSNSLNFKAKVTSEKDKKMVKWLEKQAEIPNGLIHDMFLAKTKFSEENLSEVLKGDSKEYVFGNKKIGITQLEIAELENLVRNNLSQILKILNEFKQEKDLSMAFLTSCDLEKDFNLFVTSDKEMQELLEKIFKVDFKDNVARRDGLILRKEIIPLVIRNT